MYEDTLKSDYDKLIFAGEVMSLYQEEMFENIKKQQLSASDFNEYIREIIDAHNVEIYLYKLADEIKNKNELATLINEINK